MGLPSNEALSPSAKGPEDELVCPDEYHWLFDVDTLRFARREDLLKQHGLEEPPRDCPHYPFNLSEGSATIWDRTVRNLSMAAGESHIVITAYSRTEAQDLVFYAHLSGFREEGLPRIGATFQKIEQSSYQSVADHTRQNWLYLLHEIKNPISILKTAEDLEFQAATDTSAAEARETRLFAINSLEDHLRNGVFLATDDSRMIPNNPEPTDLKLLFEEIKTAFTTLLRIQNNKLQISLNIDSHQVARIDKTLLTQLLNNLLLNKLNNLSNTTVTLQCSLGSSHPDESSTLLVITIEDTGPAFPQEVLAGSEKDADLEGLMQIKMNSGLGLPICRRITSVMGGEMKLYNDPPKTRIRIWLPLI